MAEDFVVRIDTRLAGGVLRYHTWPTLQRQTVAEHTWNLLRIYFSVADSPSVDVLHYITFHDVGEMVAGDLPYPIKQENPELKSIVNKLELLSHSDQMHYWNSTQSYHLKDEELRLIKHIELTEMAEFGLVEMNLGSGYGFIVADRCLRALYEARPCAKLVQYVIIRLDLDIMQAHHGMLNPDVAERNDWWRPVKWKRLKNGDDS